MIKSNPKNNYWKLVHAIMQQYEGMIAGYALTDLAKTKPLTRWAF